MFEKYNRRRKGPLFCNGEEEEELRILVVGWRCVCLCVTKVIIFHQAPNFCSTTLIIIFEKIRLKNYFRNNFSKKNIYFLNFFPPRGVESPRPRHKIMMMMMMMMMMIVMMSMMIIMMSHLIFVQLWLDREARQS